MMNFDGYGSQMQIPYIVYFHVNKISTASGSKLKPVTLSG
jgi:hypothetical protein